MKEELEEVAHCGIIDMFGGVVLTLKIYKS